MLYTRFEASDENSDFRIKRIVLRPENFWERIQLRFSPRFYSYYPSSEFGENVFVKEMTIGSMFYIDPELIQEGEGSYTINMDIRSVNGEPVEESKSVKEYGKIELRSLESCEFKY